MVQFGKTENTSNSTVNSADLSRHQTAYILDKTSQQFINVKDIITTTNIYKNMDMTLMAATLALSIAAPLINGLIQKAINRWNDEVPIHMQKEADDDMFLIKMKLEHMGQSLRSPFSLDHVKSVKVDAKDFLHLQKEITEYLMAMTDQSMKDIISGFCKNDKPRITRGETVLMRLHQSFGTSIVSAMTYTPGTLLIGDFKYDHAIECLERIIPSSMMCTRQSFLVRKMTTVYHLNLIREQVSELEERLGSIYIVKTQQMSDDTYLTQLIPRNIDVTVQMLSAVYGYDLALLKNAHFFSLKSRQSWFLVNDPNISVEAILETKLGHSISVLGEVVEEIATHCAGIMRENSPNDDVQGIYLEADKGPFKRKIRMRQFANPLSLFDVRTDDDLLPLDRNFKTMVALIRACGTLKVHYPQLMRKSNREIEEYVYRSKLTSDMTYIIPTIQPLPTAPYENTVRDGGSVVSTMIDHAQVKSDLAVTKLYPPIPESEEVVTTGLDDLFKNTQGETIVPKGLLTLRQIPKKTMKKLQTMFNAVPFKVIRILATGKMNDLKIRLCDDEITHEILGGSDFKSSLEYRNQLWYVKGSYLFAESHQFIDCTINKDVITPLE
jgi:hypothetical protein